MNTKLTLQLDKDIINKAKLYAKANNTSLSFMVENFFQKIVAENKPEKKVQDSIVEQLSGIIDISDSNYNDDYLNYLVEKYK